MALWYILWHFGIFYGTLVYFMALWYILWHFGIFFRHLVYFMALWYTYFVVSWYIVPQKKLATLLRHSHRNLSTRRRNRNLNTGRRMLKKGDFFLLVSNLFCVGRSGFDESCKNVPL
jgi:hypothetical protein